MDDTREVLLNEWRHGFIRVHELTDSGLDIRFSDLSESEVVSLSNNQVSIVVNEIDFYKRAY